MVGLAGDADAVAFGVEFELWVDLVGCLPVLQYAFEEVTVGVVLRRRDCFIYLAVDEDLGVHRVLTGVVAGGFVESNDSRLHAGVGGVLVAVGVDVGVWRAEFGGDVEPEVEAAVLLQPQVKVA